MRKVKAVLYWLSVVPVVIDLVKGAISGVKKGLEDIRKKADDEMHKRFDIANSNRDDD